MTTVYGYMFNILKELNPLVFHVSLKDKDVMEILKSPVVAANCILTTTPYVNNITGSFQCIVSRTLESHLEGNGLLLENYVFALNLNDRCQVMVSDDCYDKLNKLYKNKIITSNV